MKYPKEENLVYLSLFLNQQTLSCSPFNYQIIPPLLVYKYLTTNYQINESKLLFILKLNIPDAKVYNEFTMSTSQLSSVQSPTASDYRLTDLIEYLYP